jgi:restriction system protein
MLDPIRLIVIFLRSFLPFLILVGLVLLARYVWFLYRQRRLSAAGLREIDRMTGKDFESRMAALFRMKGYRVEQTPYVGDWGADLILAKNRERTVAQIKRWNRKVSISTTVS